MKKIDGRRKVFEEKKCVICDTPFQVNIKNKRDRQRQCCQPKCSAKLGSLNSKPVDAKCKTCGIDFKIKKQVYNSEGNNYCSVSCRKKRITNKCVVCDNEFQTDRATTIVCSDTCRWKYNNSKTTTITCFDCGVKQERPTFTVNSLAKRYFCSVRCSNRTFARENPNRYGSKWASIRNKKVKEDNYTCQRCNKRTLEPYGLNVHHIIPIDEFENLDEANAPENLETLCFECHMEHHGIQY